MSFQINTVYADGRVETRNATEEEVAEQEARLAAAAVDFTIIRAERNALLTSSDWTQLTDSPLSAEDKQAWADYRQALRDLPDTFTTVDEVIWPGRP
jgi:acyl carrier protein phosphodiesterase